MKSELPSGLTQKILNLKNERENRKFKINKKKKQKSNSVHE